MLIFSVFHILYSYFLLPAHFISAPRYFYRSFCQNGNQCQVVIELYSKTYQFADTTSTLS